MPSSATITGKTGAGLTMTAQVFNGVNSFTFNTDTEIITIVQGPKSTDIDVSAATTYTWTLASAPNNFTLVIS